MGRGYRSIFASFCSTARNNEVNTQSGYIYILPSGSNRSSNRNYPRSWSWKTSWSHPYSVTTDRIGMRGTYQNVYTRATSSKNGNSIGSILSKRMWSCLNSRPHRGRSCRLKLTNRDLVAWNWPIVIISHQSAKIVSERIDYYHFASKPAISKKPNDQQRWAYRGVRNGSHGNGNAALRIYYIDNLV